MPVPISVISIPPIAFAFVGLIWTRFSLKAKREHKPFLTTVRGIAALISFGVAAFLIWMEFFLLAV